MAIYKWCPRCNCRHEKGYKCSNNKGREHYSQDYRNKTKHIYNDKRWKKLSKYAKSINPYCMRCYSTECLEVHHIYKLVDDESKAFDIDNCVVLCRKCHSYVDRNCKSGTVDFKYKKLEWDIKY